jgi:hypothetical protein
MFFSKLVAYPLTFFTAIALAQASVPTQSVGDLSLSDWTGVVPAEVGEGAWMKLPGEAVYRYADGPQGTYNHGFRRLNDSAANWLNYGALKFSLYLPTDAAVDVVVRIAPYGATAKEQMIASNFQVGGEGWHEVALPWHAFDFERARTVFLGEVKELHIEVKAVAEGVAEQVRLRDVRVVLGETVALDAPVQSKPGQPGEEVEYRVRVSNCTTKTQPISLGFIKYGWEVMDATVEPDRVELPPDGQAEVKVTVRVPENIAAGGQEKQVLRAIPGGRADAAASLELTTLRALSHPYILHTPGRWEEVRDKVKNYAWARKAADKQITRADRYQVPVAAHKDPDDNHGPYLFATQNEQGVMACGIAYQLTGEKKYAEKIKTFLLRLTDPEDGYAATYRSCHQAFVQEGHFFQHISMAYDMVLPSGVFTEEDQAQIATGLRLFMETVDLGNLGGTINNWNLAEVTGAFYCALALQDLERAERFFSGPGGIAEQMARGTMDDGWWYECAIGYNVWCASEFTQAALAYEPFGYNFRDAAVPASYSKDAMLSAPGTEEQLSGGQIQPGVNLNSLKNPFGMNKELWGPRRKNTRQITDLWNSLLPFIDYRGVMFGVNDATEREVGGEPYELAYYVYRDPAYAAIVKRGGQERDLLYGVPELPEDTPEQFRDSAHADNVGVVMLRSQAANRPVDEQIQAVLHYGTHGWAHGHFDRTGLLSLMRYGRSFFNPEMVWYAYESFMYKFYVQTSIAKNIVVVDRKMQEATPGELRLFHAGELMQAALVQTEARWSYPPYGGMIYQYLPAHDLREKLWQEGRSMPLPEDAPDYASLTGYTEPVLQRRLMVVTDDYVLLADYVRGDQPHEYESLLQMKGFKGLEGPGKAFIGHAAQWDEDPIGSAQFITDVDRYAVDAPSWASFSMRFGEGADNRGTRTAGNTDGALDFEVFTLWPPRQHIMIGTTPENHEIRKQLFYKVTGNGKVLAEGQFGSWILGQAAIDVPVEGVETLKLETRFDIRDEENIFWADAHIVTAAGEKIPLAELPLTYTDIRQPPVANKDYQQGPVKIQGIAYDNAIPGQPTKKQQAGTVTVDLRGVGAARFVATLGGDYPLGDESQRRKTFAVSAPEPSETARFLTLIEPHEGNPVVVSAEAVDADTLCVKLADGRVQTLKLKNFTGADGQVEVHMSETRDGRLVREESATAFPDGE